MIPRALATLAARSCLFASVVTALPAASAYREPVANHARAALVGETPPPAERIAVNASHPGEHPALRELAGFAVNAGPISDLFDPDHRRSALDAAVAGGFRHLRITGLLAASAGDDRERLDTVFADLLSRGLKPILVVETTPAFRPHGLARYTDFVSQLRRRLGSQELALWWFEVIPGEKTTDVFVRDYEAAVAALRAIDPTYRVGGPGYPVAGPVDPELQLFFGQIQKEKISLGFLSVQAGKLPVPGDPGITAAGDNNAMARAVMSVSSLAEEARVPAVVSVWAPVYPAPDDALNSTSLAASRLLAVLRQSVTRGGLQPLRSAPVFAYSSLADKRGGDFGPGLIAPDGTAKPLLSAFAFLHRLHPLQLPTTSRRTIVTRTADPAEGLRMLAWHYSPARPGDTSLLAPDFEAASAPDLAFTIDGLPAGPHELRVRRVAHPRNVETVSPPEIVRADTGGKVGFTLALRQNELCFAELIPVR